MEGETDGAVFEFDLSDLFNAPQQPNNEQEVDVRPPDDPEGPPDDPEGILDDYIASKRNPETEKKTKREAAAFQKWIVDNHDDPTPLEKVEPARLNLYLGLYMINVRKQDGTSYEPGSLSSMFGSVKRYLEYQKYGHNIVTSELFKSARDALASRKKELKAEGLGNFPNRAEGLEPEDEENLWDKGILGSHSPRTLRNTLWFLCNKSLGCRGRQEARQMRWGDLQLKSNIHGEYMEFYERTTKTRQLGGKARKFLPKLWPNLSKPERCPIYLYREYKKHRPYDMLEEDVPFYLVVNDKRAPHSQCWYQRQAMGKNELGKIMKELAKKAGMEGKYTNHSTRRTCINKLMQANVPPVIVQQLSGHTNIQSVLGYSTASLTQQKAMYNITSNQDITTGLPSAHAAPPQWETIQPPLAALQSPPVAARSLPSAALGAPPPSADPPSVRARPSAALGAPPPTPAARRPPSAALGAPPSAARKRPAAALGAAPPSPKRPYQVQEPVEDHAMALAIQEEDWDEPMEGETALPVPRLPAAAPSTLAANQRAETMLRGLFSGANISGGTFNINIKM